ncbi:4'-phosphopantetheinyl transferase superfamily protein [Lysinibacillus sphaericus]|uniref:4'-phosphopantetheinyl transferase superfamily protein n=1 Tax=Lysinibacillus sphaericus TaxID=1421 RepID=A0A544V0Q6_LYSSH|nr:4'-phosphopantetheinyl transferase superfamily protein [Lysinibacillus sp. SDF0037]TQR39691.1 4'-phosphopantetheinyl transferase superfamily protein [Lysinibacillus sp. SDF0037]
MEEKKIKNFIYLSKINPALSQQIFNDLLQIISKENREKCQRFKFKEDALRTLYGELIVRHFLSKHFSLKNKNIGILKSDAGKPYIKDFPIRFNISHAGDFVVCAFSEQEIGIDIEQIEEIDLEIAKRFFCQCEYEDLLVQRTTDRLDYFYSLWTLKESYMKWLGYGISIPLDSFYFKITDAGISCFDNIRKITPSFKQYFIEGYKLSVCSMIHDFPDNIERISIEEMMY